MSNNEDYMDDATLNEHNSSEDECVYLTQPNSQESNAPFSQSTLAFDFESLCQPVNLEREVSKVAVDGELSSDDDDESSFEDYDEVSVGSVDLECDEDVDIEVTDDIPESGRMMKVMEDYDVEANLFSESDLKEWKLKEEKLVQRFKNGYYRCKRKNSEVYEQICELYKPYITEEHLRQLHHNFSTQHNEAMNNSVSAFAPKGKTYSKTESLETRVAIAACVQILGYELFWELVYKDFGVSFDGNLRNIIPHLNLPPSNKTQILL